MLCETQKTSLALHKKFFISDIFNKCDQTGDLVIFTEEIRKAWYSLGF